MIASWIQYPLFEDGDSAAMCKEKSPWFYSFASWQATATIYLATSCFFFGMGVSMAFCLHDYHQQKKSCKIAKEAIEFLEVVPYTSETYRNDDDPDDARPDGVCCI